MLSYSRGLDEPLWEKTIGQILDRTVERCGDSLALVSHHQRESVSWRELRDLADCVARGLWSLGLEPGDRVGLWSTNCIEWTMLQLGCARAGTILVNVNPAYRRHELTFTLRKSRMKALFLWQCDSRSDYAQILEEASRDQDIPLRHVVYFGTPQWERFLQATEEIHPSMVLKIVDHAAYDREDFE